MDKEKIQYFFERGCSVQFIVEYFDACHVVISRMTRGIERNRSDVKTLRHEIETALIARRSEYVVSLMLDVPIEYVHFLATGKIKCDLCDREDERTYYRGHMLCGECLSGDLSELKPTESHKLGNVMRPAANNNDTNT